MVRTRSKKRAQAAGDEDCERSLIEKIRLVEERNINRKLTVITKGNNARGLDRIEIATHDWFHSEQINELYHYKEGSFEAYPWKEGERFFAHHFLTVLPKDTKHGLVKKEGEGDLRILHRLDWYHSQEQDELYH